MVLACSVKRTGAIAVTGCGTEDAYAAGNGEHGYGTGGLALPPVVVRRAVRCAAIDRHHRALGMNTVLYGSGAMIR